MKKIKDNILSWCENPENGAIQQAINISNHPWLVGNVCLMPDTHEGYGMPIGGVAALDKAICPNMVGVDIGCGMLAMKIELKDITKQQLEDIYSEIKNCIPVGFKHNSEKQSHKIFTEYLWESSLTPICGREFDSAQYQIGTLGGGNHFIEIQRDDDGYIWFMIHSGSRNLGKQVAEFYNKKAEELCERFKQYKIVEDELAILPVGAEEFDMYKSEMALCLQFSLANRELMAKKIMNCFDKIIKKDGLFPYEYINIHHNYASLENHYGKNVYVHRKGATLAKEGKLGIIPGSQGTSSYIVEGLGNKASLCSCSHGAGRKMSRKKARENLNIEEEKSVLEKQGILHSIRTIEDLDEASSAYKNIDEVMEQQKDLVKIITKLNPLAVIKG
mgnify:CR=1 FL=1